MQITRRFKSVADSGASYVVVSCKHAAHRMRQLGLPELSTINAEGDFLTVAIVPCPRRKPGCLPALLNEAKQLHHQMGCQMDIALFSYGKGECTVEHLNREILGPIDKLLTRMWSGEVPVLSGKRMELSEAVALYPYFSEDVRMKSSAELAQDFEQAKQDNPPYSFLSVDYPVGRVVVCGHQLRELSAVQLAEKVKLSNPLCSTLVFCPSCESALRDPDNLKVLSQAEIEQYEERTQRMARWFAAGEVRILIRSVDGYRITLVSCAHVAGQTRATTFKIVPHFLKTHSSKSLVDEQSRVIVCLDCPEHRSECVQKQDEVATQAAVACDLQFFIVIRFDSHTTDGKPVDRLLIKNILQPAEPHEVFDIVHTPKPPQVHTAEESMAPDSRTEDATKVAPRASCS